MAVLAVPLRKLGSNRRRIFGIWTDLIWWVLLDMQGHAERNIECGVKMWLIEYEIPLTIFAEQDDFKENSIEITEHGR